MKKLNLSKEEIDFINRDPMENKTKNDIAFLYLLKTVLGYLLYTEEDYMAKKLPDYSSKDKIVIETTINIYNSLIAPKLSDSNVDKNIKKRILKIVNNDFAFKK